MMFPTLTSVISQQRARVIAAITSGGVALSIMLVLVGTQELTELKVFAIPYIASAAVVAMAPTAPLARPAAIVLAYPVAVITALIVTAITGPSMYAAALGSAIAITFMVVLKAPHVPAIAAAALIGLTNPGSQYLLDSLLVIPLVIAVALLAGRLLPSYTYPAAWR